MKEKPAFHEEQPTPLKLDIAGERWSLAKVQRFAFPQPPAPEHRLESRERRPEYMVESTSPYLPATGDITAVPAGERRHLGLAAVQQTAAPLKTRRPDRRRIISDTTYPWRCCGRVITAAGQCTGALVGPRHLLTVSHIVDWTNTNGKIGWLRFEPGYFDGDVFPPAHAVEIYSYDRIVTTTVDDSEVASDYVVCVLDRNVGDENGWFGSRIYDPNWDDYSYWSHVGYPDDLGGGCRPFFEGPITVKNSWRPGFLEKGQGRNILIHASTSNGNSGGPFFGWWDEGPYIVGVVCAAGSLNPVISHPIIRNGNWVGGGEPLPSLILQARTEFP
jgi:V8-like Glu-specific endopeptidase